MIHINEDLRFRAAHLNSFELENTGRNKNKLNWHGGAYLALAMFMPRTAPYKYQLNSHRGEIYNQCVTKNINQTVITGHKNKAANENESHIHLRHMAAHPLVNPPRLTLAESRCKKPAPCQAKSRCRHAVIHPSGGKPQ